MQKQRLQKNILFFANDSQLTLNVYLSSSGSTKLASKPPDSCELATSAIRSIDWIQYNRVVFFCLFVV